MCFRLQSKKSHLNGQAFGGQIYDFPQNTWQSFPGEASSCLEIKACPAASQRLDEEANFAEKPWAFVDGDGATQLARP
jgi:hypothetical protein